ncbi:MAG: SDR family oxidoreductase [Marinifilaceae bacterium]
MEKKIALVTGSNRGIGFEACRQLAKNGFKVIFTCRNEQKGMEACNFLIASGLDIVFHRLDVTSPEEIDNISQMIKKEFGRLDVLVNNAGVYLDKELELLSLNPEIVRNTMEVNLIGPLRLCQTFIPLMLEKGYGRVVNISSTMGSLNEMVGRSGAYRMSKTAMNSLTRILADEVDGSPVKVNAMCPGWVRTDMGGPMAPLSPLKATKTLLWLATLPEDGPNGGYFRNNKPLPW